MMAFFANLFGYLLNFINNIVQNYGFAIIIFCIVIKIIMIPLSIKQQRSMKKNGKLQKKLKEIQFKYKNDPEKLNQATINLYKEEKMSPFSGCFTAIIQLILLLSIFYLVRQPLTYMKKIDKTVIDNYQNIMVEEKIAEKSNYSEIDLIREIDKLEALENEKVNKNELESMKINTSFLGLDLSSIPTKNASDWKVFIIPVLYVVISIISMRFTMNIGGKKKKKDKLKLLNENNEEIIEEKEDNKEDMTDAMERMNKNMSLTFPIMYLAVAIISPLGLALYWLVNSLLMIVEKLLLNKFIKDEEE